MPLIAEKWGAIQLTQQLLDRMSKGAEPKTEYGTINLWTLCPEEKEFCCVFSYISKLFLFEKIKRKNEGKSSARQRTRIFLRKTRRIIKMSFFTTAVTGLKTVVTAIGAGVGVWGVINLLEGYGNDNPGAKSQGIKQLMSGGGIIIVAQTVIPQLSTLFS